MSVKIIKYSNRFKLGIIKEIEENGLSISECQLKYGIRGSQTIQNWLNKYGKNHLLNKVVRIETMDEKDELKHLREENKRLKIAYAELSLHHKCSEAVIEISDEMFGLDFKKKYEQELLKHSVQKKK